MSAVPDALERGRALVERTAGVLLEPPDLSAFAAAVDEGMSRMGVPRWADYFERLESGLAAQELECLLELVVNNETYFFREPRHFQVLRKLLLETYGDGEGAKKGKLRVLSAGCSTGEEPYSLAIELLELMPRLCGLDFEVVGVDISRRALDVARAGIYRANSFRSPLDSGRQETWFEPAGDGAYVLADRVRNKVDFRCLNLRTKRPLRETLGLVDVVFFRNVLIYLSPSARIGVGRSLASLLRESGHLFVGISEMLPPIAADLVPQQLDGVHFWRKDGSDHELGSRGNDRGGEVNAPPPTAAGDRGATPGEVGAAVSAADLDSCYNTALGHVREDRPEDALKLLLQIRERAPGHPEACRLAAELQLDRGDFEQALRLAEQVAEKNEDLAWPCVLRGRISYHRGDTADAQRELKRAIYNQPGHWPAHFFLAEVHRVNGEPIHATRAYRNALKNLEKAAGDGGDPGIDFIGYTREAIALTCRVNIRSQPEPSSQPREPFQGRDERHG